MSSQRPSRFISRLCEGAIGLALVAIATALFNWSHIGPLINPAPVAPPADTQIDSLERDERPRAPTGPLVRVEASRMSMACLYAIEAYGTDKALVARTLEAALDEVDRIDRLMSHYRDDSPLSAINRQAAAAPVVVDPELFAFIAEAVRYSQESDGAFDITVGPLMKTWGFFRGEGRRPTPQDVTEARTRIGYRHLQLDGAARTVRFDTPGVELDLGGIAKGYAVDRAVALLKRSRAIEAALLSAGGSSVYAIGAPPGKAAWDVAVQDPVDTRTVAFTLPLNDRALSISGSSEKFFEIDGVRYGHIMDPRTGEPVSDTLSVIVLSETATDGDALDNALLVLGPDQGSTWLTRHHPTAEAYFFLPGHVDPARSWRCFHASGDADAIGECKLSPAPATQR